MAQTGAPILGKNCRLYHSSAVLSSASWTEVGKIQGLNKTQGKDVAEIKERGLNETVVLPGHVTREVSFQLTRRPGNTQYDAIADAFENGTKICLAVMTGTITEEGQRGYQAMWHVTQFDDDQAHDSTAVNVTIRPAADYGSGDAPVAVQIAGS